MSDIPVSGSPALPSHAPVSHAEESALRDFSTNSRVLVLSGMAVCVGAIGAVAAWVLQWLIAVITNLAFYHQWSSEHSTPQGHALGYWVIGVPVIGALIIGLMARFGSEKIRGHGIPEALEAILLGRSRIQLKVALLKPISAAISIGTGGPFGAEGPIIMTGGAFGSLFAQRFHLSAAERKTLLVAGAAAGMAAVFSAPVAAVLLAVELLLFEWKPRSFIPVVIAAAVAATVRVPLLGSGALFYITPHQALPFTGLAFAAGVGVIVGLGSGLATTLVYAVEDFFLKLPIHWMWWPALGAVVVGIGGVLDPRVLGTGYETIHGMLRGEVIGASLLALLVAKFVVWSVALGSGTSGGVLAPLLILGGAMGAMLGQWIPVGDVGLWALVGMAAMMGGTMRVPLTAVVFAMELTEDFHLCTGLLIGTVCSYAVTVLLMRRSILTEKLARRGHHISCEYSVDPFELARVKDVMDRNPPKVLANLPLNTLVDRLAKGDPALTSRQATLLVDENERLSGILTRGDMLRAMSDADSGTRTVSELGTTDLVVTHPEESLHDALTKMLSRDIGRLPVVEPGEPRRIVGYLGRAALLTARRKLLEEEHIRER
ncbi:chloride channel protein [Roseimicrobium sp. ORNL1]|uniref:chloride channel protein n=1 Tax=Roseimicrobium sp. ORNL1 TaxID=2711231 RepID=UPI0013E15060|nr:chloride channel protein [Roseimicrobium sp. ORNL1]QIF03746.1 chloride channel protein [Roseimicrobium sp. ORNL1]